MSVNGPMTDREHTTSPRSPPNYDLRDQPRRLTTELNIKLTDSFWDCRAALSKVRRHYRSGVVQYHYEPLNQDRREIRVFDLAPGPWYAPLQGSLRIVSLDDNPEYDALSYLWGDDRHYSSLCVGDNGEIRVHRNLARALLDLRSRQRILRTPNITLWTDAICINQSDQSEKSHQIRMMGQVYRKARFVRAWIDEVVDPRADAFKLLSTLRTQSCIEDRDVKFWYPVAKIFRNPYWKRVWVQQELMLAQEIIVHCRQTAYRSESLLNFQRLVQGASTVMYNSNAINPLNGVRRFLGSQQAFLGGVQEGRLYVDFNRPVERLKVSLGTVNILDVFISTSKLHCTKRHDRVYGLLGIMADIDVDHITVDYHVTLSQIYAQLMERFIEKYQSLAFLCYYPQQLYVSDIPSWLPDPEKDCNISWQAISASCSSGLCRPSAARIHDQGLALSVRVLLIDQVSLVYRPRGGLADVPLSDWLAVLEGVCHKMWPWQEGRSIWLVDDVVNLIFTPFVKSWSRLASGGNNLNPEEQRSAMIEIFQSRQVSALSLYECWQKGRYAFDISETGWEALQALYYGIRYRTFIGTASNRLGLAWLPNVRPHDESFILFKHLRALDEIWILFGCPTPVILRPHPDKEGGYTRVSFASIAGLMNGEACEGLSETGDPEPGYTGPPVQEITLW